MMEMSQYDPLEFIVSCLEGNDYESALDVINALHEEGLDDEERGRLAALEYLCYQSAEADGTADTLLKRLHDGAADDSKSVAAAAAQFAELDAAEEAEELFRRLCEVEPERPEWHFQLAELLEDLEQYEESAAFYATTTRLKPEMAEAWLGFADSLSEIDMLEEAADAYSQYLALRPNDQQVLIDYASLLGDLKRFDEAETLFQRAEKLGGDETDLYYYWAAVASARNDRERLETCQEVLSANASETWQAKLVDALMAEQNGEIWPGWESCREAFDIAWEEDDETGIETAAETAIHFAIEHGMEDTLEDFMPLIFEAGVFSMSVLAAIRHAQSVTSEKAKDYEVSVEGDAAEEEVDDAMGGAIEEGPPYRYFRSYRVLAESPAQAEEFVRDFEDRCGAGRLIVHSVQPLPWEGAADLGVWNRSEAHYFSSHDDSGV